MIYGIIGIIAGVVGVLISILMFFRNNWVYKKRIELVHEDVMEFLKMPSYDSMFWRFWIWDIEEFKKEKN